MTKVFLILHVLAAILAIGPVAVAASRFPAVVRATPQDAVSLHRLCRVYAVIGIAVPVFGFGTAGAMHVMGDAWVIASIGLTALAAAVLAVMILPRQQAALDAALQPAGEGGSQAATVTATAKQLAMFTGVFNLLWAAVTILMILRPGSTTGA
ncbi:hypothetical protein FPZ12_032515 [Amycolatopsis acidicola]|uniref:DUF2269 family protein n=1 Tax=Amycolatopsis acidicola TaxID=2596893 RepID=A0A5N0UVZ3_9PSEU|nr:hypothetical protein [Amycolatopsis acidicola]KAA9154327.1 hypothetical protein FPZ12_032515 [Amycolatopsis acidicola]